MTRTTRSHHASVFHDGHDFNEQLYLALRNSPWWMISIAVHALVLLLAYLLPTPEASADTGPQMVVEVQAKDDPLEPEPPEAPEDIQAPTPEPPRIPDPSPVEMEKADHDEDDADLPYDETLGESESLASSPFNGPADNSTIGIGGGAGPFGRRGRGGDENKRRDGGGPGKRTQDAVEDALRWLAAHQSPDGRWECAGFDRWCDGAPAPEGLRPDGLGMPMYDVGVTGLALCAFLGAGYTHRGDHPFAKVVGRGLKWLKNVQDAEGCFGPRASQHYIYNHATAALAMVEAYGMTESPLMRGSAQKGLDFIALARNPYFAWRYGVKPGDNDTSVTGWMMMALKSAKLINLDSAARGKAAPLQIDEEAFVGIRSWVEKMTDKDVGRVGYLTPGSGPARPRDLVDRFPTDKSESMTAVGVLARIFIGEDPRKSEVVRKGTALLLARPPTWNPADGSIDMYYWYYATLAMFQVGGDGWVKWNEAMASAVVKSQRTDTDFCRYKGSWDPLDPWGPDGGRVYSTALMAMCLEVYYRYPRVFGAR